jgi:diguanylate cyclase (GGDEF)-like protein
MDIVISCRPTETLSDICSDGRFAVGITALIVIGHDGPADVVLPADTTPRELALACTLLTEIVMLRSQRSESISARGHLQNLAYSDPLTGIANRRAWDEELARRRNQPSAGPARWGLAILDLDRFKEINDRYGHTTGDHVLKRAAHAIAAGVRASDFAARLGGDEFGLLLANVDSADAASVVERIRRGVAAQCSGPAGPNVTASAGFAILVEPDTCETLFERADCALRHAKEKGRDRTLGA